MAVVAIRKIALEYLTAAAGPTSHSPPPMEVAAKTAPGPMTLNRLRNPNGGGAGNSSTVQGAMAPESAGSSSADFLSLIDCIARIVAPQVWAQQCYIEKPALKQKGQRKQLVGRVRSSKIRLLWRPKPSRRNIGATR